jgi:hypothetical protein
MKKFILPIVALAVLTAYITSCKKADSVDNTPKADSLKVGLLAHYAFNNNAIDSSSNANNGTINDLTAISDRYSKVNSAFYFNGINGFINVPDKAALRLSNTDFTLNFWVKLDNYKINGSNILAKHLTGNDQGWVISITGTSASTPGVVRFGPGGASLAATGTKTISLNQWHMVTATYKNVDKKLSIYVDNILDNVISNIPSPNAAIASSLFIGRDEPTASTDGYFVKGGIDEVRIYNRILSAPQITKLYLPALPAQAVDSLKLDVLAHYAFNSNAIDSTGNGNDGTVVNLTALADRNAKANSAYYFNGTNGYVSVPDKAALRLNNTNFTLNFWIKLDNYTLYGSNVLAKHLSGNDLGWVIGINGINATVPGAVHFGPGGTSASADGTKALTLNQWHMVTATYNTTTKNFTIYVDGVLDKITPNIPSPNATITSSLYIGRDEPTASADGYFVKGGIDEVKIFSRILPVSQITKLLTYKN